MTVSAEEACAVLRAHLQAGDEADRERRFQAVPIPDTSLWIVRAYEVDARPGVETVHVVGPDGRLWSFSGDRQVHDLDAAIAILGRIYAERLAAHVDPARFAQRLTEVTEAHRRLSDGVVADARSGSLKSQRRTLP